MKSTNFSLTLFIVLACLVPYIHSFCEIPDNGLCEKNIILGNKISDLLAEVSSTIPDIHERTLILIKPDGVQRGLVGKIISRLEEKGFKLIGLKFMKADKETAKLHRSDKPKHMLEPIFSFTVDYLTMGPVVAMCWEGHDIIRGVRRMLGKTSPLDSSPGTIRGDFGIDTGRNVMHASDTNISAKYEIELWFDESELISWSRISDLWVYKDYLQRMDNN